MQKKTDTPLMKQYWAIKEQYADMFLFFRMGDFYELFFDDAVAASKVLNITLTYRDKAKKVPLAGVPYHAIDQYLEKMIAAGHKAAICDQVEDPKQARGIVKRKVTRLVTPGTIMEQGLLRGNDNNFTCSIYLGGNRGRVGFAYVDISTGDFSAMEFNDNSEFSMLKTEIARIEPREFLIQERMRGKKNFFRVAGIDPSKTTFMQKFSFDTDHASRTIRSVFAVSTLAGFGLDKKKDAVSASGALLDYLSETQLRQLDNIHRIRVVETAGFMTLDAVTQRNLELVKNLHLQTKNGSLLDTIDHTLTPAGSRLLKEWLLQPLTDISQINRRLDGVGEFVENRGLRGRARNILKQVMDIERISSRITQNILSPRDLVALVSSISIFPEIEKILKEATSPVLSEMVLLWDNLKDIKQLIAGAISDSPPASIRDAGVIRELYNPEVDRLRSILKNSKSIILEIEGKERQRTGIDTLKVKFNNVFGYYIEVSRAKSAGVPDDYVRKQTLVNAERFINQELKEVEATVLNAEGLLSTLEKKLFEEIRLKVAKENHRIKAAAILVSIIDVISAFAELAVKHHYVRPGLNDSLEISIRGGRHPVLSAGDSEFVPNNIYMDGDQKRLLIITGPNMAGKSTFMRQTALIAIMAQTGSFVPANEARIGIVDKLFTRVGASDNLLEGQSTFMVEMSETANILNNATARSLVILDEIGRGTSTYDGLSIARAVAEYIHDKSLLGARTLFATHYHEMTGLELKYEGVANCSISIKESGHKLIFLRKIVNGPSDKSYGVHVARLAGLPKVVVNRAFEILATLETAPNGMQSRLKSLNKMKPPSLFPDLNQPGLRQSGQGKKEIEEHKKLVDEIGNIDLAAITPIEALNVLNRLQDKWCGS